MVRDMKGVVFTLQAMTSARHLPVCLKLMENSENTAVAEWRKVMPHSLSCCATVESVER